MLQVRSRWVSFFSSVIVMVTSRNGRSDGGRRGNLRQGHRSTASRQDDCCDGDAGRSHDGSHAEGFAESAVESVQAWHVAVHTAGDDRGADGESDRPPIDWVMLMRPPAT